ncbi:MAG: hypothetical protein ACJ790_13495 [Myxococcaceae bacterium]
MWLNLVRNTEWATFIDLVSPSFFEVLPPTALSGQAKELISNYVSRARFLRVREEIAASLDATALGVDMRSALPKNASNTELTDFEKQARGDAVLRLFFHQLFSSDTAVLDLRSRSFAADETRLVWNPSPLFVRWEPDFLPPLRDLYVGFYSDDAARFRSGLEALKLTAAEDVFRQHFGGQSGVVQFRLADFQKSFHQAFVRCREAGSRLHGNFLPLGLFLACLYEHLEKLGQPLDVRAAFERVYRRSEVGAEATAASA